MSEGRKMTKNNVRAKKNIKKKNRAFDMTSLMIAFFIVVVSIVGVNCYIQQYEKNYEMNQLKRELAEVQNEGELMDIEYQSRANYRTIEAYVSEHMSMKKISNYQIEYIDDGNNDRMQVIEHDENNGFFSQLSKAFSVILEYFQ